jgi:hypothetical protein
MKNRKVNDYNRTRIDKKTLLPQFYFKKCYDSSDSDKRNNHQQLSERRFTWPCLIFLKTAERIASIKYLKEEKDILDNMHKRLESLTLINKRQ